MVVSDFSFYWNNMVFNLNEFDKIKKDKNFFTNNELITY